MSSHGHFQTTEAIGLEVVANSCIITNILTNFCISMELGSDFVAEEWVLMVFADGG